MLTGHRTKQRLVVFRATCRILLIGTVCTLPCAARAQSTNPNTTQRASQRRLPKGFVSRTVALPEGGHRNYAVFLPPQYALNESHRWPVIVFLHGSAERGIDGIRQTTIGLPVYVSQNARSFPFIVVMPQAKEMWFRGEEAIAVWEILEDVHKHFRTDLDRVYLTGLSMGGIGTWELAVLRPDVFAAIVPVCGIAPKEYLKNIVHLPVWAFHGAQDKNVSVNGSREAINELKRLGGKPLYTEYPLLGHICWDEAYATPELWRWLLKQRRKPPPSEIDYRLPTGIIRVWWLGVESAKKLTKPARIRAKLTDDGRLDITSNDVVGFAVISKSKPLIPGMQIDVTWNQVPVYKGVFNGVISVEPVEEDESQPLAESRPATDNESD